MPGDVTALDVSEEVLSCFWDLAAIEGDKRAEAALKLLEHLKESQNAYGTGSGNKNSKNGGSGLDGAVERCSPLVAYSIRRLYKGLTSGRKGARQGFALALTTALKHLGCFQSGNILALVDSMNELSVGGGRDEFFGQMFGLGAVVRAQKLDAGVARAITEQAIELAHKKSFLREAAAALITELADRNPESISKVLAGPSRVRAWLTAPVDQACPEALALAIRLWRFMPQELKKICELLPSCSAVPSAELFAHGRKQKDKNDKTVAAAFFSEGHLRKLLPVLRTTTQGHPRVNIVWPTMLTLLLPGYLPDQTEKSAEKAPHSAVADSDLAVFWSVLVEGDIFESASHERKFLGFTVFGQILPLLKTEGIASLLTPNFMHALATNVSKKDSVLRPVAQLCMDQLGTVISQSADSDARTQVLLAVERHGNGFLVKLLKAHKIQEAQGSDADIVSRVKQLKKEFESSVEGGEGSSLGRQKSVLGQLAGIAKRQQGGVAVATDIFKFLVDKSFFKAAKDAENDGESFEVASHCASLLISTVDAVSRAQAMAQQQQRRKDDKGEALKDPLDTVAAYVEKRVASGAETFQAATEESAEASTTLGKLRSTLVTLLSKKKMANSDALEARKQAEALKHLVVLLELHALCHPATADPALASDLEKVVGSVFLGTTATENGTSADEEEETVQWEDALVDIVLTMLSRNETPLPSAPLRDAAERLFKVFASHVTATGVEDLLQVVARPLDEQESDDEEESGEDSDEEMEEEEEESGSEEESDEEEEEEESGSDQEDENANGSEEEDKSGSEEDEDIDETATDEQMFKMDAQLGAYFASMQKGRDAKKVRQEVIGFKLRALACLEMVMKRVPESPLTVIMASPLLNALVSARKPSGDVALSERLAGILRNQLPRCKPEMAELEIEEEELRAQLKRTLYYASRYEDKAVQDAASSVFFFLVRAAFAGGEAVAEEFAAAAVNDFFQKKKTKLSLITIQQLLRRLPEAAAAALPVMLEACVSGRNEFIRQEAFTLVELAVKVVQDDVASILKTNSEALTQVILAAVKGDFTKKQRRTEALKAVCNVGENLKGRGTELGTLLGSKGTKEVQEALEEALESKKDAHLARLASLLETAAPVVAAKPQAKKTPSKKRAAPKPAAKPAKKK